MHSHDHEFAEAMNTVNAEGFHETDWCEEDVASVPVERLLRLVSAALAVAYARARDGDE